MPGLAGLGMLAVCCILSTGVAGGCQASTRDNSEIVLRMHPAFRLGGNTGGNTEWTREVQKRLGCDPCEEFRHVERTGEEVTYLYTSSSAMSLSRADVVSASLLPIARDGRVLKYMLLLTLSDSGRDRVKAYELEHKEAMTVNEIGGKLVGLKPLALSYDQYIAATIENESEAIAAAAALEVPVHRDEPIEDPARAAERSL